jgi:hypothetical protein
VKKTRAPDVTLRAVATRQPQGVMPMNTVMFLVLRATHILFAGVWIGSTVYSSLLLTPVIEESGSAGGQVMMRLGRRGLDVYMRALGMTTIVTGLYLLWRFTGGFDPAVAATHAGVAFGVGGLAGLAAGVVGAAVIGRSAGQVMKILTDATSMADGPAKGALLQRAAGLRHRIKAATRVVMVLQATALVLMAVGHYV